MKIYIAGPISGKTSDEVLTYFNSTQISLEGWGYQVYSPMLAKSKFRTGAYKAHGNTSPVTTDNAIVKRDFWMTNQADVLYTNFTNADRASIGSCCEIAWAYASSVPKLIVVAMPEENVHEHAFIINMATHVFPTHENAMSYLEKVANSLELRNRLSAKYDDYMALVDMSMRV
jgi:hypothetical protein